MKNKNISLSFPQITASLGRLLRPIGRHFMFIYILILLLGVGTIILFIALAFSTDDQAYREQKEMEFSSDVQLNKDKKVVDHILRLQTADAGPIKPNYDPSRDNPFRE
ncbi:MAG TPA: hypothetical protein VFZ58_01230 [Candidatus Saccharimonadales bacterium]